MTPPTSTPLPSEGAQSEGAQSEGVPNEGARSGGAQSGGVAAAAAARASLTRLAGSWGRADLAGLGPEADLFAQLDSFAVVELLLETESAVEAAVGVYVPLASESLLDADKSPLRRLQGWIDYVAATVGETVGETVSRGRGDARADG